MAYTSNPDSLLDGEWTTNGGGLKVSHKFGFGAVDAEAFVTRARRWINVYVPEQQSQSFYPAQSYGYAHKSELFKKKTSVVHVQVIYLHI